MTVRPLVGKDLVRSHFHPDAITGRITSSNIQMHNLPTGGREGDIIPDAGYIALYITLDDGDNAEKYLDQFIVNLTN